MAAARNRVFIGYLLDWLQGLGADPRKRRLNVGFKAGAAHGNRAGASLLGPVAQWLEPAAHNGLVAGSSPAGPTSEASMEVHWPPYDR